MFLKILLIHSDVKIQFSVVVPPFSHDQESRIRHIRIKLADFASIQVFALTKWLVSRRLFNFWKIYLHLNTPIASHLSLGIKALKKLDFNLLENSFTRFFNPMPFDKFKWKSPIFQQFLVIFPCRRAWPFVELIWILSTKDALCKEWLIIVNNF